MSEPSRARILGVLREVYWRWWNAVVTIIVTLKAVLDWVGENIIPKRPGLKPLWDSYYVLPSFSFSTWFYLCAGSVVVLTLFGAYRFAAKLLRQYDNATSHRIIPHVLKQFSQVYLSSSLGKPAIKAQIAIRLENIDAGDVTLKEIRLKLYERGFGIWKGWTQEREIRGLTPSHLLRFDNPSQGVLITGLRIKSRDYPADKYFFVNTVYPNPWETPNSTHFLRLTVDAVAQKKYMIDLDVDWTNPGAQILSATPVFDTRRTIEWGERQPRFRAVIARVIRRLQAWFRRRKELTTS